mmetsp:Transcript_10590/g.34643  ORF Transcript_10590/g.34643 Transcript_10590/m.34643 type:complete len:334 (-) Transcript_10590:234-1235(-)
MLAEPVRMAEPVRKQSRRPKERRLATANSTTARAPPPPPSPPPPPPPPPPRAGASALAARASHSQTASSSARQVSGRQLRLARRHSAAASLALALQAWLGARSSPTLGGCRLARGREVSRSPQKLGGGGRLGGARLAAQMRQHCRWAPFVSHAQHSHVQAAAAAAAPPPSNAPAPSAAAPSAAATATTSAAAAAPSPPPRSGGTEPQRGHRISPPPLPGRSSAPQTQASQHGQPHASKHAVDPLSPHTEQGGSDAPRAASRAAKERSRATSSTAYTAAALAIPAPYRRESASRSRASSASDSMAPPGQRSDRVGAAPATSRCLTAPCRRRRAA